MRAPEFWSSPGLMPRMLGPASHLYAAGACLRRLITSPVKAGAPVICVGNLVAGGAGKTPVTLALAAALRGRVAVQVLARGYGGTERGPLRVDPLRHGPAQVGDEALLLAAAAPTWVARNRPAGASAAADDGAQLLLLDDGFQDPALSHDLSLLVIDGGYGYGNGRVMPAGPLREPATAGFARCDAVVLIGPDTVGVAATIPSTIPALRARFVPSPGAERFAGRAVYAFAGIGRPDKFFRTLAESRCRVAGTRSFPDHHPYRPEEIMAVCEAAAAAQAVPITTAKDAVRLPASARGMVETFPVDLEWESPAALGALLAPVLARIR